jgi:spore germination cell wall hydrolase CwlJ-like protein
MAARWVELSRSQNKKKKSRTVKGALHQSRHALGAVGILVMAAGMNFALYPDALAEVVSGERSIVSFVPTELAALAGIAAPVEPAPIEVRLLAATMWGEARSEGEDGMRAVAHVMVNRIGPRFGETLSTVILSPRQFSVWNRGDPNRRLVMNLVANPEPYTSGENALAWERAQVIAREVLSGQSVDPTGGALFYHTRAVRPRWAPQGVGRQTIGQHIFYADVPDPGIRRTPRTIDIAQALRLPMDQTSRSTSPAPASARGPRAGRVNGVIQYAPPQAARQPLPSEAVADVNATATPTIDGVAAIEASAP